MQMVTLKVDNGVGRRLRCVFAKDFGPLVDKFTVDALGVAFSFCQTIPTNNLY